MSVWISYLRAASAGCLLRSTHYKSLALENTIDLIPFLLEGVGGVRELNLPDGIHPTVEGHQIVAETVWKTLRPVLEALRKEV